MICPCGGDVLESYYYRKTWKKIIYTRRCQGCGREEKSIDFKKWFSPRHFWENMGK